MIEIVPWCIRMTAILFSSVLLAACGYAGSEQFVAKPVEDAIGNVQHYVFPPGPAPEGVAQIVVPHVVDRRSARTCTRIELGRDSTAQLFGLNPVSLLSRESADEAVVVSMRFATRLEDRGSVRDAIVSFLEAAASRGDLECLREAAHPVIVQAVLDSLPVRLDQVLPLAVKLNRETRSVDLLPGQELCVSHTDGRFRRVQELNSKFDGAGAVHCYPISRFPASTQAPAEDAIVFSSFLATIGGSNVGRSDGTTDTRRWVAGQLDLADKPSMLTRTRLRLIFPSDLPAHNESSPLRMPHELPWLIAANCPGSVEILETCAAKAGAKVVGGMCNEPTKITDCGKKVLKSIRARDPELAARFETCAGVNFSNWAPRCYVFRERGVPIPYFRVTLNGVPESVEVGTTVWNVVERFQFLAHDRLLDEIGGKTAVRRELKREFESLSMTRWFRGRRYPVVFEPPSFESLQLPLLQGDEIRP